MPAPVPIIQGHLFGDPELVLPFGRRDIGAPHWLVAKKADRVGAKLADEHYSRRAVGSRQFVPPGETLVLVSRDETAVFAWCRPHPASGVKSMNGIDGWTCTIFRNTGRVLSSLLILEAEACLLMEKGSCGPGGLVTYVWPAKVASSNPGACFQCAGWRRIGRSADGKKRLWQKPWTMVGRTGKRAA